MKAISMWQPWASLLACGAKQYETRSWATSYRGPIAIHAAARKCDTSGISGSALYAIIQAIRPITEKSARTAMYLPLDPLPFGAVIATAELIECYRMQIDTKTHRIAIYDSHGKQSSVSLCEQELLFGDWTPGRFAWQLANPVLFDKPIPAIGHKGFWDWNN